jgi:hypothetical protein
MTSRELKEEAMATPVARFTARQRQALEAVRDRHYGHGDLFSERELAQLRFIRWLYETAQFETEGSVEPVFAASTPYWPPRSGQVH